MCDCGNGIYWAVEDGENLEGMVGCAKYKRNRWKRRRNKAKKEKGEEEMEEWEKEELTAMWKFQGACDANKIIYEKE